ncbi:MAG: hypothetical protein LC772_00405 [Chloroflexi bacterium]|nr:hypothetical protein [Chloroflexota bacterium]
MGDGMERTKSYTFCCGVDYGIVVTQDAAGVCLEPVWTVDRGLGETFDLRSRWYYWQPRNPRDVLEIGQKVRMQYTQGEGKYGFNPRRWIFKAAVLRDWNSYNKPPELSGISGQLSTGLPIDGLIMEEAEQ